MHHLPLSSLHVIFPWSNTNNFNFTIRSNGFCQIHNSHTWDFGTNISPPCIRSKFSITNSTACSNVIQNRVIRSSVTGSTPVWRIFLKNGTTLPRLPTTFPYLTTAKRVFFSPTYAFAATNNLSEASFVAPYKFTGAHALSVDRAITFQLHSQLQLQ